MDGVIFHAAKGGDIKALQQQQQRVLTQLTYEGNTVLHIGARYGHSHIVDWILRLRPCLALSRNTDKNTPLHEAAKKRENGGVVKALLQYSHRPASTRNQFGETALVIAAANGHVDAVELLLQATPFCMLFWPRNDHQTCLAAAVYGGHPRVVKSILNDRPTCFNILHLILLIRDGFGATPLHAAVHSGHVEIVNDILNISFQLPCQMQRCDKTLMTMKDKHGRCAVHIAAMMGNLKIVDLFMNKSPDCVEIRCDRLKTVLHWAVEYNQIEVVRKLLDGNDADVNAKLVSYDSDRCGNTALHLGALKGVDPELMEYLLSFPEVDVNAMNEKGLTAFNIASEEGKFQDTPNFAEITSILKNANAVQRMVTPVRESHESSDHESGDEGSKIADIDTLVASLIATVTFSAMFQVPGGYKEDAGVARLSLTTVFNVFLFSNCVAFFASMSVVLAWIFRQRLQTKVDLHRSVLGKLSMLSLATSVIATGLAFLCATILVTVPRDLEDRKNEYEKHQYEMIFRGEMVTAFAVPSLALLFLSIAWLFKYNFKATNARQSELRSELKRVVISTLPVGTILLVIIFVFIVKNWESM